jgi:queuosine precursor transporter
MIDISVIGLWILITLAVTSFTAVLGKKYGVEYLIGTMAALTVMANIFASKIVLFGPFTVPAGVIVFSMTFLITDLLSEVWGKKAAKKAIWVGFYVNVILVVSVFIVVNWPAAPFALDFAEKFGEVLALAPRIAIAGFIAYVISQNHDVWAFHFWKKLTKGKHLWLRNNASTIVSQLIDSVVFITIAFYGLFPIWPLILGQWIVKVFIAILDTPFMYIILGMLKKIK